VFIGGMVALPLAIQQAKRFGTSEAFFMRQATKWPSAGILSGTLTAEFRRSIAEIPVVLERPSYGSALLRQRFV
jgi:hypothetical protein